MAVTPISGEIQAQPLNDNFSDVENNINTHKADNVDPHGAKQQAIDWTKSFGLGNSLNNVRFDGDLNTLVDTRFLFATALSSNRPTSNPGYIVNIYYDDTYIKQMFFGNSTSNFYIREKSAGTWNNWVKVVTEYAVAAGTGSPEGVITASVGTLYRRTDGGANTTLYVKESGTGNTGWVAK